MKLGFLLLLCFLQSDLVCVFAQNSDSGEQRHFSAEDETVKRPVPLPGIAAALARDPDVIEIVQTEHPPGSKLPNSWFLTSEVRLSGPRETDIVVVGRWPVHGANVTMFWIFRPTDGKVDLLLKAIAHTLIIKDTRSSGYRDIETISAAAVTVSSQIFRFDGARFKMASSASGSIQ